MSDNDTERRSRLLSVKLAALVRSVQPDIADALRVEPCALGTALVSADTIWILVDGETKRSLGPALAWALRHSGDQQSHEIHLVADDLCGVLARQAAQFHMPITVWRTDGAQLVIAQPDDHVQHVSDALDGDDFFSQIHHAGAEPLVEHGVMVGEVCGLEICRVIRDATTDDARLEVGIGAHDREAFAMVHGDKPTHESIATVIEAVLAHRYVDAPFHPYNALAAERFLRWRAVQTPELIGMSTLQPVDPPVKRENLKDPMPCVGRGTDASGREVIAVFVHGVDLDVVPFAVDAAAMYDTQSVMIVSRPQDVTTSLRAMAARAKPDISFVPLR